MLITPRGLKNSERVARHSEGLIVDAECIPSAVRKDIMKRTGLVG